MHVLVRDLHVIRVRQDERRIESRHATPRQHHSGSFACRSMCQNTHIPRACFVPDTGARTNAKRSCRSQPCWRSCPTGSRANVPVPMSDRVVVAPRSWLGWSHRGGTWVRPHLGRMLRAALCTAYSPTVAETRVDATSTTGMRLGMELLDPIDLEAKFQVQGGLRLALRTVLQQAVEARCLLFFPRTSHAPSPRRTSSSVVQRSSAAAGKG